MAALFLPNGHPTLAQRPQDKEIVGQVKLSVPVGLHDESRTAPTTASGNGTFHGDGPSQRAFARISVRKARPEKRPVTGGRMGGLMKATEQLTIAKAISRMQRAEFVKRIPDPHDRRVMRLQPTARGPANEFYRTQCSAHEVKFSPLNRDPVEVKGLEPSASTLRT